MTLSTVCKNSQTPSFIKTPSPMYLTILIELKFNCAHLNLDSKTEESVKTTYDIHGRPMSLKLVIVSVLKEATEKSSY